MVAKCPLPMVVDADAMNALMGKLSVLKRAPALRVLTPHAGEFKRLSGVKPFTDADRRTQARAFARKYGCVLVLKGHRTVVADPSGKVYVNRTGNPGMATAGSGDVLTGMIAAFLAQGSAAFDAARYGAHFHGLAGDRASRKARPFAMIASDMVPETGL
jgi:NAD(P)H-hydrate epimerase